MRFFWCVAFVCSVCSCNRQNLKYDKSYFDFDSLTHKQVSKLSQANAKVIKKTFLNGKNDSIMFVPDTLQWKNELATFQQLDVINKPMYKGNYQLKIHADDHSNLLVNSYTTSLKSPVPEIKFFYQESPRKLKKIESVFSERNMLFSSSRKLTLEFEEQSGIDLITRYRVEGFQKMVLSDTVTFSILAKVIY